MRSNTPTRTEVTVTLAATDGRLEVTVTDDGRGRGGRDHRASDCAACRTGSQPWTARVTLQPGPAGGTTLRAEFVCA